MFSEHLPRLRAWVEELAGSGGAGGGGGTPVGPAFDALTRPLLRPLRRVVPPIASVDLTPLVLLVILQVLLIPLAHLRLLAAGLP